MTKALSKANGESKKAQALYIEWRVNILKEEALAELKRINNEDKQRGTTLHSLKNGKTLMKAPDQFIPS